MHGLYGVDLHGIFVYGVYWVPGCSLTGHSDGILAPSQISKLYIQEQRQTCRY